MLDSTALIPYNYWLIGTMARSAPFQMARKSVIRGIVEFKFQSPGKLPAFWQGVPMTAFIAVITLLVLLAMATTTSKNR